jgi:cell division protein FtsN
MDGLGSRKVVVESAVESRPIALRAAAFMPATNLSPILPKTPAALPMTPVVPGAVTSPIVPNETTPAEVHKTRKDLNRRELNRRRAQKSRSRRVSDLVPAYPDAPQYVRLEIKPDFVMRGPDRSKNAALVHTEALKVALKPGSGAGDGANRVWGIQVGAFDLKSQAKDHAAKLRGNAQDIIGRAKPVVLAVKIAGKTKYRLRFGPFQASLAGDVCRKLVARKFVCGVVQDGNWNRPDSPLPTFASS